MEAPRLSNTSVKKSTVLSEIEQNMPDSLYGHGLPDQFMSFSQNSIATPNKQVDSLIKIENKRGKIIMDMETVEKPHRT